MKNTKLIIYSFVLAMLFCTSSQAKWWIFGQSQDEINIKYLYLNKTSFDESTEKITVYRDSIPDGRIYVKGKATIKTGEIADVRGYPGQ